MREKKENDMNKKTKLLLVLLSSTALTAGAFGLAACSGEAHNEEYYAQYQQYVSATAEGEALSYEDWLIGILEDAKGEKGDKGDTGEAGKAGTQWTVGESDPAATSGADGDFYLNKTTFDVYNKANGTWTKIGSIKGSDGAAGATGDGIDTIVYKNGALEVTLKSGSKITVALPDEITHVHTYNDTLTTLIEPTVDYEGLAYKECTDADCGHIELVVIPKLQYEITVEYDGAPVSGVKVTVTGEDIAEEGYISAVTDENGKISVSPDAAGEYTISVEGYVVISGGMTSSTTNEVTTQVAKAVGEGVTEAGIYAVVVESSSFMMDYGWGDPELVETITPQTVKLIAGDSNVKFKVTLLGNADAVFVSSSYGDSLADVESDGSYQEYVKAGESTDIYCSIDKTYFDNGKYEYGDKITYAIKVEYLEAPADGTIPEFALDASALTEDGITITAEPDQWIYYTWTNPDTGYSRLNVTLGEGTTLEFTTKSNWTDVPVTLTESGVVKFTDTALESKFSFKVKSSTGAISLSADLYAAEGEMFNPAELTLDTAATGTVSNTSPKYYYKWTAAEAGNYTLVLDGASIAEVYSDEDYIDMLLNIQSGRDIFAAEAGHTYYFVASTNNVYTVHDYSITLRKTNAEDAGYSALYPTELTTDSGTLAFNDFKGSKYYAFTNSGSEAVTVHLGIPEVENTSVSVTYYSDKEFSNSLGYDDYVATVEAGKSVYMEIQAYTAPNTFTGNVTVEFGTPGATEEPDITEGVDPEDIKTLEGTTIAEAGYWKVSLTEEHWSNLFKYYEIELKLTLPEGTYNISCSNGATLCDLYGGALTQVTSDGGVISFYLDANQIGDYVIAIVAA